MTSTIKDIDMKFEENKNFKIEAIGSISEITWPCPIQYKSMKIQQPQVQDRPKKLTEFRKDGQAILKFLFSSNFMSMSLIVDVISWIFVSVFWMFVICLRKTTNSWLFDE
jgi:uncharacterized membrane protein